jgi:hypothetical protein
MKWQVTVYKNQSASVVIEAPTGLAAKRLAATKFSEMLEDDTLWDTAHCEVGEADLALADAPEE